MAYCRKFVHNRYQALLSLAQNNASLAMRYNSNSAKGVFAGAFADLFAGNTERAMDGIARAIQLDPGNPQLQYIKARALRDLGRRDEAKAVYREIVRERPNFWPAYNEIGFMQAANSQYKKAAEAFGAAAAMAPKVALPLANQGSMYLQLHDNAAAEDAYRRSLQRAPNAFAYTNLGNILYERKNYREALDYYGKARDLAPKDHRAWRNLADCYTMVGDARQSRDAYSNAAEVLSASLSVNPRPAENWVYLAFYHAKLGQRDQAGQDLQNAAQRPGKISAHTQLVKAQAMALLGRKEEALQLVLDCLDQEISTLDVDLALDLADVRADPRYRRRVAKH